MPSRTRQDERSDVAVSDVTIGLERHLAAPRERAFVPEGTPVSFIGKERGCDMDRILKSCK